MPFILFEMMFLSNTLEEKGRETESRGTNGI